MAVAGGGVQGSHALGQDGLRVRTTFEQEADLSASGKKKEKQVWIVGEGGKTRKEEGRAEEEEEEEEEKRHEDRSGGSAW